MHPCNPRRLIILCRHAAFCDYDWFAESGKCRILLSEEVPEGAVCSMIHMGQSPGPKEATADIIHPGIARIIRYAIDVTNWTPAEVEFLPCQMAP
jgi:hypothetical protein